MITANYRNATDIVAQILKSAQDSNDGRITKPQLMYKAFLSFEQLNKYLPMLTDSGLLDYDDESERYYKVTDKGMKFLKMYDKIIEYVSIMPEV